MIYRDIQLLLLLYIPLQVSASPQVIPLDRPPDLTTGYPPHFPAQSHGQAGAPVAVFAFPGVLPMIYPQPVVVPAVNMPVPPPPLTTPLGRIGNNLDVVDPIDIEPEALMSVPELIQHWGYPIEEHKVITADGYILTLHRIPYGK
ncbi:ab-hydrolase associated lipase region, partial [Oesophagostomum dentatum]